MPEPVLPGDEAPLNGPSYRVADDRHPLQDLFDELGRVPEWDEGEWDDGSWDDPRTQLETMERALWLHEKEEANRAASRRLGPRGVRW
jgi:hypothetical protein